MMIAYCATLPFSIAHLDLARDIAYGLGISRGTAFPVEGPVLASAIHAGPIWFYLLSLPLLVSPTWLAVSLFIGVVASLKFPLAYVLGSRLADRQTGVLWALLLLFPGWMTLESVLQNHASLVATCTLAFLIALTAYARTGSRLLVAAAALLFSLALHAHPSTIGLGLLLAAALAYRAWRSPPAATLDVVAAAASAIAPFLPYVVSQLASGASDIDRALTFIQNASLIGSWRNVDDVLIGTLLGGTRFVTETFVTGSPAGVIAAIMLGCLLLLCAVVGHAIDLANARRRLLLVAAVVSTLLVTLTVAVLRLWTPYYMTFVVWVLVTGIVAAGVRASLAHQLLRWPTATVIALGVAGIAVTQVCMARTIDRGEYAFAFFPLFDVKQPFQAGTPMPFATARALRRSGKALCAEETIAAHGSLAVHLLHDYALEARLACGRAAHIRLGGESGTKLVGVSRRIRRALGVPADRAVGPIGVLPVVQVIQPRTGIPVPDPSTYPPVGGIYRDAPPQPIRFTARADEAVLVTDMFFAFGNAPTAAAFANGERVEPAARDLVSTAFVCSRCAADAAVDWRLDVASPAIERVDIVTFAIPESRR
jgi:hypothetical protein